MSLNIKFQSKNELNKVLEDQAVQYRKDSIEYNSMQMEDLIDNLLNGEVVTIYYGKKSVKVAKVLGDDNAANQPAPKPKSV